MCEEKSNSGGERESLVCPLASNFTTTKLVLAIFNKSKTYNSNANKKLDLSINIIMYCSIINLKYLLFRTRDCFEQLLGLKKVFSCS